VHVIAKENRLKALKNRDIESKNLATDSRGLVCHLRRQPPRDSLKLIFYSSSQTLLQFLQLFIATLIGQINRRERIGSFIAGENEESLMSFGTNPD
jgi:hypothetical protein